MNSVVAIRLLVSRFDLVCFGIVFFGYVLWLGSCELMVDVVVLLLCFVMKVCIEIVVFWCVFDGGCVGYGY